MCAQVPFPGKQTSSLGELHVEGLLRRLLRTMYQEGCGRIEESKIQQRKTCNCDSVARGAAADGTSSSGSGMDLQRCPKRR